MSTQQLIATARGIFWSLIDKLTSYIAIADSKINFCKTIYAIQLASQLYIYIHIIDQSAVKVIRSTQHTKYDHHIYSGLSTSSIITTCERNNTCTTMNIWETRNIVIYVAMFMCNYGWINWLLSQKGSYQLYVLSIKIVWHVARYWGSMCKHRKDIWI